MLFATRRPVAIYALRRSIALVALLRQSEPVVPHPCRRAFLDSVVCIEGKLNLDTFVKDEIVIVLNDLTVESSSGDLRLCNLLRIPLLEIGRKLGGLDASRIWFCVRVSRVEEIRFLLGINLALLCYVICVEDVSAGTLTIVATTHLLE